MSGESWGEGPASREDIWGDDNRAEEGQVARINTEFGGKELLQEAPMPFDFAAKTAGEFLQGMGMLLLASAASAGECMCMHVWTLMLAWVTEYTFFCFFKTVDVM
jgi:hypothetical protein